LLVDARSDLLHQVSRHARYNGIAFARGNGAPITPVAPPDPLGLLNDILILEAVRGDDRVGLASSLVGREGKAGDTLFTQGGVLASLFVIAKGAFEVMRDDGQHGRRRIGTIGPGDFVGEFALLTGAPHAATVTALTPFVAYELTKNMIAPLLESNPDLLHALENAASRVQASLERTVAAQAGPGMPASAHVLDRIRTFFGVRDRLPAQHEVAAIRPQVAID
jgi:CRP-like cAMP-binding protein